MTRQVVMAMAALICAMTANAAEPVAAEQAPEQQPAPAAQEDLSATAGPRVRTSADAPQLAAPAANDKRANDKPKPAGPVGPDRLQLDTTIVQGNRELPKVLYIVPWKKADIGELPSQPFNSLLDEALTPVDRDVFRREVTYYGVISEMSAAPADKTPAQQQ